MVLEEAPSLIGQRGPHLDLGPQIQRGDAQDRLPTSGTASLAWLEEEPPRWCRPSLASPKASENMSRRTREDTAVRRELEMLEEKMMRQVLRLQEQSERFMDIMMHPLEAKVTALEGRQPVIDCGIAELRGNLKGIQESMEIQVRRNDQSETRMCNWRKTLEEELQSWRGEVNSRLEEGPAPSDTVSRSELVDLAKALKKELKKLVEESFQDGHVVSQKELTALGSALREELGSVEKLAAETASAKLQGHQELMAAAEAVRAEMKTLTEKAIQEEALVRASMSALQELEKVSDRSKGALEALDRRMARCEFDVKELRTTRAQAAEKVAPAAEAETAPAQEPLLDELLQRMARFERLEEDLRADVDSHQGLLRALQETQLHSQDAMNLKVDGVSEIAKQLSRCEEQIEELQTQLRDAVQPGNSLAFSEATLLPDLTERLEKCERQNQDFQQLGRSSANEIERCEEQVKELRLLVDEKSLDPQATAQIGAMSQQIRRCEEQVKELQEELGAQKSSKAEVSAFNPHEEEDLTDHQLMLLDLQQRVLSLEGGQGSCGGDLVASSPQSVVLGQAAELMQKIELDLQQARAAVVPGLDMTPTIQEASERGMVPELPLLPPLAPSLPPLAAMKVMASPRLQRLSMTPRLQEVSAERVEAAANRVVAFATGEESLSLAFDPRDPDPSLSELRAEVAAVWDAIAELAEIVGDAAPQGAVRYSQSSSLGHLLQTTKDANEKAETCQGDLRRVEAAVQELDSRMLGCERKLREAGNKEDVFATFDVTSFKEPKPAAAVAVAPSRLTRAFGDLPAVPMKGRPSDASSSATVSDAGEARGETT